MDTEAATDTEDKAAEPKKPTEDDSKKPTDNRKTDTCKDKHAAGRPSDCLSMRAYCTNPIYKDLMSQQCP